MGFLRKAFASALQAQAQACKVLELAITDFCNLDCYLCGQGTPLHRGKKAMTPDQIEQFSSLIRRDEFEVIKISGGEPTIHKDFGWICDNLRRLFPGRQLYLATNGALAAKYSKQLSVFDRVDLAGYPEKNDKEFVQIQAAYSGSNLFALEMRDYQEMIDVYAENNLDKVNIFANCHYRELKKIVQDRIYPCCVVFGQAQRQGFPEESVSVPFNGQWRENLAQLNIEKHCRRCFSDVEAPLASWPVRVWRRLQRSRKNPAAKSNPPLVPSTARTDESAKLRAGMPTVQ